MQQPHVNTSLSLDPLEKKLLSSLQPFLVEVETHPIFGKIQTLDQLRIFMEHHVFAVWDFMSILKFLQNILAPSTWPWVPSADGHLVHLINEIVLGEECDELHGSSANTAYASHFDLYLHAMKEVQANTHAISSFIRQVQAKGLAALTDATGIPEASRIFMKETFALLQEGEPHRVAAAFAFGRENVIPGMFQSLLSKWGVSKNQAPIFHYYLQRHTELDDEKHGPAALLLVMNLCEDNPTKLEEAFSSATEALQSRKQLWDSVLEKL